MLCTLNAALLPRFLIIPTHLAAQHADVRDTVVMMMMMILL
jgi:hypothetical protein